MLKQLKASDWVEPAASVPICTLPFKPAELSQRHQLVFEEFEDYGLGPCRFSVVSAEGVMFWLESHALGGPITELVTACVHSDAGDSRAALDALLRQLGLAEEQLYWKAEHLGPPRWALFRLDDNGIEAEMKRYHFEISARWMQKQYEARGHKQLYFIKNLAP
jgi:hypothetical protein